MFCSLCQSLGSMSRDLPQPIESAEVNVNKWLLWVCIHLTPHPSGSLVLLSCAASYLQMCQRNKLVNGIWFLEICPESRNLCLERFMERQLLYKLLVPGSSLLYLISK